MLCPATVSAAAAAVWLLAVLGPGLALPAEDNSESDVTLCSQCFHRQTPPRGASAGPLLRLLCHRLPRGQVFATLTKPTCDTAVCSAFHLRHGWTEGEGEEGEERVTEEEENTDVAVPALLRGGVDSTHAVSPTGTPLQHWDSTVTTLIQSSISPQCNALGGDLYILTGAGGLRAAEDGDEECQNKPLWSAVCCAVPGGEGSFSVGFIKETEGEERQVSLKGLQEMLGIAEMFSEGCEEAAVEAAGDEEGLDSEENLENILKSDSEAPNEETDDKAVDSDAPGQDSEGKTAADAQSEDADEVTQEASEDAAESASSSAEQPGVRRSGAVRSESTKTSADYETMEEETDANSTSTLVYVLSTTFFILTAPLRPVVSTVTQLPGQVTYVLQEDLGVLSALPGDTYSFFHLLTSDLLSWMGTAADLLLGAGETCFSCVYYCVSSMVGALLSSCHTGICGMGILACDTVGIFGGVLNNTWWVTKFFGGRLWEQSEGYAEAVIFEMGGQAKAAGGGMGKLVWRSGSCVGGVFKVGLGFILGMVDMLTGAMREGYEEYKQEPE